MSGKFFPPNNLTVLVLTTKHSDPQKGFFNVQWNNWIVDNQIFENHQIKEWWYFPKEGTGTNPNQR